MTRPAASGRSLSRRAGRVLWAMIVVGIGARAILAFKTYGVGYDIDSAKLVRAALADDPLHLYTTVNGHPFNRWPYPPGYLPLVSLSGGLADLTGLAFHGWVQTPSILADGAIAWLVQDFLGRRGAGERTRLAAAALVVFGPSFWIVSGFHGQIDSLAILPAVAALWHWDRSEPGVSRALVAGVLIGVGIAIKSVPALMLVALLPSLRSRREAAALIAPAIAVPLLAYVPFLVADAHGVSETMRSHRFLPGFGGLSLLVQPNLAGNWLNHDGNPLSAGSRFLLDHELPVLCVLMAPFALLTLLRRLDPVRAAALLWTALVLLNPGFEFEFVLWALPFALMAGWLRQVAVAQAVLFPPAAIVYWHPWGHAPTPLYAAIMIGSWCIAVAALVVLATRLARHRAPAYM